MFSIITFVKYWVTSPHVEFDTAALSEMRDFAMSVKTPGRMKELAKDLIVAVDDRVGFFFH